MATYINDLRLKEIGTGESSGTWGTETNVNLELIGEALGYGTEGITTNADTHTSTVADGATDPVRAMFVKYTGTLDSACTITIAPNTVNRMQFIENATSGSQNIIISQGSGANITIPPSDVKAVYLDGAGSGAAVVDAFANLNVVDLKVQEDLIVTSTALVTGVLTTTATQVATGGITSGSSILSDTDSTDSLGSTGVRWLKGWFDTLTAGTLTIGSGSVTDSSGAISFSNENLTTTGTLACGALTSTGIDDNATGERLQLADTNIILGASGGNFGIINAANDQDLVLSGGTAEATGANITLYGGAHGTASLVDNIIFRASGTQQLRYSDAGSSWDFQANAISTTGTLACGALTSTGIDDNATAERFQVADSIITIGGSSTGVFSIVRGTTGSTTGSVRLLSTASQSTGSSIEQFGSEHSSLAGDWRVVSGGTIQLDYDDSASEWDFQANAITTTGTLASGSATITNTSSGALTTGMLLTNATATSANTAIALYLAPNNAATARAASIVSEQTTSGNYADLTFNVAAGDTPFEGMSIATTGNVTIPAGDLAVRDLLKTTEVSIANDAAAAITPPRKGGFFFITYGGDSTTPGSTASGLVYYDVGNSLTGSLCIPLFSTNMTIAVAARTGTDGTDGKLNIGIQADSIHIENRVGSTKNFQIVFL